MMHQRSYRIVATFASLMLVLLGLYIPNANASTVVQGTNMQTDGGYLLSANGYLWSTSGSYIDVYDQYEQFIGNVYLDGHTPQSLCATPDGAYIYVTASDTGIIYEVDSSSLDILHSYQSGYVSRFTGCASDGSTVMVSAYDDSEVRAYSLDLSTFYKGYCASCWAVAYNSYTDEYEITSDDGGYMYVFDASTLDQYDSYCSYDFCATNKISTAHYDPTDIIYVGGYTWLADSNGYLEKYGSSGTRLANISISGSPWRLAYAMNSIWVTLSNDQVAAINVSTNNVSYFNVGGSNSSGIANFQGSIYVGDYNRNLVKVVASNAPPAPSGLTATRSNGSISVHWNGIAGVSRYELELRNSGNLMRSVSLSQTSYTFNGVSNGMPYTLRVAGDNSYGTGAFSSLSLGAVGPPSSPTITSTSVGASSVQVGFHIGSANGSTITSSRVVLQPSGKTCITFGTSYLQSCRIAGLTPGVRYIAQATSSNAFGTSANSAAYGFTAIGIPSAPQNFSARAAVKSVLLSFSVPLVTGGAPITIYQYSIDGGHIWTNSLYGKSLSFPVTGLRTGSMYVVGVRATNSAGPGAASKLIQVKIK